MSIFTDFENFSTFAPTEMQADSADGKGDAAPQATPIASERVDTPGQPAPEPGRPSDQRPA